MNSRIIISKVKVHTHGLINDFMWDSGKITKCMEMAASNGVMAKNMLG